AVAGLARRRPTVSASRPTAAPALRLATSRVARQQSLRIELPVPAMVIQRLCRRLHKVWPLLLSAHSTTSHHSRCGASSAARHAPARSIATTSPAALGPSPGRKVHLSLPALLHAPRLLVPLHSNC